MANLALDIIYTYQEEGKEKGEKKAKRKRIRTTRRKGSKTKEGAGIKWKNLPLDESGQYKY